MADQAHLERTAKALADSGHLIEMGWVSLRLSIGLIDAPPDQLQQMRTAFFAGAQHLLSCVTNMMDPGQEPTDDDMRRMDMIAAELDRFMKEFALRLPTEGNA